MIIYKATNKINGKIYIGKTAKSLSNRKSRHKSNAKNKKYHFHNAINKYSLNGFNWEIIDTANTIEELNQKEIYHIALTSAFSCNNIGYNTTSGGDNGPIKYGKDNGMYGKKRPEIVKLMSELRKDVPLKEEHKEKIKESMQKYVGENNPAKRQESRKKISEKAKKRKVSIYGIIYTSINELCEKLNMSRSTVKQRLNSKSERFRKWKKLELY